MQFSSANRHTHKCRWQEAWLKLRYKAQTILTVFTSQTSMKLSKSSWITQNIQFVRRVSASRVTSPLTDVSSTTHISPWCQKYAYAAHLQTATKFDSLSAELAGARANFQNFTFCYLREFFFPYIYNSQIETTDPFTFDVKPKKKFSVVYSLTEIRNFSMWWSSRWIG